MENFITRCQFVSRFKAFFMCFHAALSTRTYRGSFPCQPNRNGVGGGASLMYGFSLADWDVSFRLIGRRRRVWLAGDNWSLLTCQTPDWSIRHTVQDYCERDEIGWDDLLGRWLLQTRFGFMSFDWGVSYKHEMPECHNMTVWNILCIHIIRIIY